MLDIIITTTLLIVGFVIYSIILFKVLLPRAVNPILDDLTEVLATGPVKSAMSILGKQSGEKRSNKAMVEGMAGDVLNSERLQGLKMALSFIGIDLDEYIGQYGPMQTLTGLQQLAGLVGLDVNQILSGQALNITTPSGSNTDNPYLR